MRVTGAKKLQRQLSELPDEVRDQIAKVIRRNVEAGVLQTDTLSNYEITGTPFTIKIGPKDGFNWPVTQDRSDAIRIEYVAGYGTSPSDVPETLRHTMMLLIGHWYDNRENIMMDELSNIPYGFDMLLDMHRRSWYG